MNTATATALPPDFGKGWMTPGARDLAKIAVALGGFDAQELIERLGKVPFRGHDIRPSTVERILDEMQAAWDAAHA